MKPQKSDFHTFVQFSEHIPDKLINPHIEDAYKFDIKGKLEQLAIDIYAFDGSLTTKPQLKTFYEDYILQWWVLLAYKRFIAVHGTNVTPFGVTLTKDPQGTFEQVDVSVRAVYLKQLLSDANTCYNIILAQDWKFDDVTYRKPGGCHTRSNNFGINVLD